MNVEDLYNPCLSDVFSKDLQRYALKQKKEMKKRTISIAHSWADSTSFDENRCALIALNLVL